MAAPAKTKVKTSDFDAEPARDARLFLIDGSSLAYRSFFALPQEIATADGRPTNALLGFANMLVKLIADFEPQTVIVAWDVGGETKRKQAFAEYKSQRPEMPDLLSQQWPLFRPLVDAFGFANVSMPEYEADDVIGTLSAMAEERGIKTCIVTYDRDAMQLVSDQTVVMMTSKGVSDVAVFTPERVRARYGVTPAQIADFIALRGDTSDNIPGIPGIGDKTAADLLRDFGSLANILDSIDKVSGAKRKENLAEFGDQSRMSQQLATIVRDLPLEIDLDAIHAEAPDRSRLNELFQQLEFRTLARRVSELELAGPREGGVGGAPASDGALTAPATDSGELIAARVVSPQELGATLANNPRQDAVPVVVRMADDGSVVAAVRVSERMPDAPDSDQTAQDWIAALRCSPGALGAALAGQRITTFDWKGLPPEVRWRAGDEQATAIELGDDLLLASYLLQPGRRTLLLGELQGELGLGVRLTFSSDDQDLLDVARQAALLPPFRDETCARLEAQGMLSLYRDVELPLVPVLAHMERLGIRIDQYRMGEIAATVSDQLDELVDRAHELAGEEFTLGSPKQLAEILFEKLGLPAQRKGKTGYSTDARVLRDLRDMHPIVAVIEQWRELSKLKGTYLDALPALLDPRSGRIHTTFSQVTAATGRLSSINPNLQNIPVRTPVGREIRSAFVPEEGWKFVSVDYSQVELRLLAHVSGEPRLIEAFERGEDVHRATAAEVAGIEPSAVTREQRSAAKAINFGIIYGISSFGLAAQLGISREEAQTYIELYLGRYPMVGDFIDRTIASAGEHGYVSTLFGRRRPIPELKSRSYTTRQLGERLAVNSVLQGPAADIIKVAMVRVAAQLEEEGLRSRIVLQIHDELLLESPPEETAAVTTLVRDAMTGAFDMSPPLAVDHGVGDNWLDAK
jgi:DNA polymerase-1